MSKIIFYDLVPTSDTPIGPSFSPFCMRARLALLRKNIDFETQFVTYHDLRFGGWKEKLGVDLVTAPIIRKPDGSFLMDSTEIALWLDANYPSQPNLFLPAASEPVDLDSKNYKETVEKFESVFKDIVDLESSEQKGIRKRGEFWCAVFWLYARRIVSLFDKETADYWIQDDRLGDGTWTSVVTSDPEPLVKQIQVGCRKFSTYLSEQNAQFFSSRDEPGMADFALFGNLQLIRSVSPQLFERCFLSQDGTFSEWINRMNELFPMKDVRERDATKEIEVCHK
ncbi:hypothetical protein JCM3765_003098 [Sporobolomyces pararoseus]